MLDGFPWWMRKKKQWATYLSLPGSAGNNVSVADNAALDITGDIDIRVWIAVNDWTPAALRVLLSKFLTTGNQRSYQLTLNTDGTIALTTSTNGAAGGSLVAATSTAATGLTDGAAKWLRVTRDVDNGAAGNTTTFYLGNDGVAWTQLGDAVVNAGTTSIHAGTADLRLGTDTADGATSRWAGKIYQAQIFSGIAGSKVFDVDFTKGPAYTTSFTDSASSLAVTVNQSGAPNAEVVFL